MEFTVTFKRDIDGFLSQQCSACKGRFKVKQPTEHDAAVAHCPYCALEDKEWWTPEQSQYIMETQKDQAQMLVDNEIESIVNDLARDIMSKHPNISVSAEQSVPSSLILPVLRPEEPELPMNQIDFECCNASIKYAEDLVKGRLCCVVCGTERIL